MDITKRLVFLYLLLFSSFTFASLYNFTEPGTGVLRSTPNGLSVHTAGGNANLENLRMRSTPQFTFSTADGKRVGFTASRLSNISTGRVGSALVKFARSTTPIGLGVTAATLLCTETDICENAFGEFEKSGDPAFADWPTSTPLDQHYCAVFNNTLCAQTTAPTQDIACSLMSVQFGENMSFDGNNKCVGDVFITDVIPISGCHPSYTSNGTGCTSNFDEARTPTDQDWEDAANNPALNDDSVVPDLIAGNQPIPVGAPDPMAPQNFITSSETTTLRDADGNITGSQVTERTVNIQDVSTESEPNLFDISEKKTVTNYDINNNITNTETTNINNEPPPPEEPTEFEFDDMPENNIEQHQVENELQMESWGASGSCPAPNSVSTSVGTLEFSYQPACDFAIAVKPIVITLSSFIGLGIIVSIRTS